SYSYFSDATANTSIGNEVAASGTYYIVGVIGLGRSDTVGVAVTINPQPVLTVTPPAAVCAPETIDLSTTISGGTSYSYFSDATRSEERRVGEEASGRYYTVEVNGVGSADEGRIAVTINPQPVLQV